MDEVERRAHQAVERGRAQAVPGVVERAHGQPAVDERARWRASRGPGSGPCSEAEKKKKRSSGARRGSRWASASTYEPTPVGLKSDGLQVEADVHARGFYLSRSG